MVNGHEVCGIKCMSWTGVVAGALIAVGLSFLLNLFCASLGLSLFNTPTDGAITIAFGGYIGMMIGIIAIMYFSGWVAGYFARPFCTNRCFGALHGIIAWCLALVIAVIIGAQTTKFVTTNMQMLTQRHVSTAKLFNDVTVKFANEPKVSNSVNKALDQQVAISKDKTVSFMTLAAFLTFSLFFVGAIFSAIGGYCGLKSKECCN